MSQINLISPTNFPSAVLIADLAATIGGSNDSTPQLTQVNGETASIALEIQSILGAVLFPRVTTTQMNAMTPANGMIVYNTTADSFYGYTAGMWGALGSGGGGSGTVTSITAGANIVLTPSPITTTGSVALTTTVTGLTSAVIGTITLSGSNIASSGSIVLQTNGTTTALTLDTSQNATFAHNVAVDNILYLIGSVSGNIGFDASATTTSYVLTWPAAAPAGNGYILSSTTGGTLSWIANAETSGTADTLAWFNDSGVLASNTNVTVDTSGDIVTTGTFKAGNITLTTSNVNSTGSLVLGTNGTTTALTLNTSQNAVFAGTVNSGNITLSTSNINSSGSLILGTNGSTTALTLNTSQNASFAGTVTSGNITLSTSNVNSSGSLVFGTNGSTTALTLNASQNAVFAGTVNSGNITLSTSNINSSGSLVLGTNGSTTAVTVDTSQNATFAGVITAANGKYIAYGSANQAISATTQTSVNFETNVVNTMTNFTVTSNNTYTYTGTGTVYYMVGFSVGVSSFASGDYYGASIIHTGTSIMYGITALIPGSTNSFSLGCCTMIALTNGQAFNVSVFGGAAFHVSNGTGGSSLTIYQLP